MNKLFIGVISFMFLLFIYWTAIYFANGYNLTDNVRHLDLYSMFGNLDNKYVELEINFNSVQDTINNALTGFINDIDTAIGDAPKSIAIVLTGIKYLAKYVYFLVSSTASVVNIINAINNAIALMLNFAFAFVRFLINPIFI